MLGEKAYVMEMEESLGLSRADVPKRIKKFLDQGLMRLKAGKEVERGRIKILETTGSGRRYLRSQINVRKVSPSVAEEAVMHYRRLDT